MTSCESFRSLYFSGIMNSKMAVKHGSAGMFRIFLGLVCCAAFGLQAGAAAVSSGDWPQWRGPNRDDVSQEKGLLQDWPAGGPPLAWKAAGLGEGYSTVSVQADRIYTIGDRKDASYVIALDLADGKQIWAAKLGKAGAPGWGGFSGPRSTPTVSGKLVFALGQWGELVCFDADTGKEQWRKDYTKDFGGSRPEWGFSESPLVDAGRVVFTPGGSKGTLAAVFKATGEKIWQTKDLTDSGQYASPIVAEIGGVRQYIQLTYKSVVGVSAGEGQLLWRAPFRGETAVIPTPIYADGCVYVCSGYGAGDMLVKITEAGGKFKADQVYANKVMVNHHGGVLKVGDYVYGYSDSKGWTCQDFKTGAARWQDKDKLGKGSLTYADGRLYLRQEDKPGTVAIIEAAPSGYKEHGRFEPPARSDKQSWPHPVVAQSKLFLRDQDVLLCYDVKAR
jgi:outer membrane protein assembly factor BamB